MSEGWGYTVCMPAAIYAGKITRGNSRSLLPVQPKTNWKESFDPTFFFGEVITFLRRFLSRHFPLSAASALVLCCPAVESVAFACSSGWSSLQSAPGFAPEDA